MLYRNDNQRESGTPYMRNAAKTQFERTMKREGKTVTTYTSGTEFRAFFRTRDEHENQRETIIMYYDVTSPVRQGTLVMIGYGIFLALNRETVENGIYYKSTLIKCNGVFNENTGKVYNVPFYCSNMKSSVSIGNSTISMLNGNIECITEENSLSKQIDINQHFNEFGRTFCVTNKYSIDGIVHLIAEVAANQEVNFTYTIQIDRIPNTTVYPNDTVQLEATPYINDNIMSKATFNWTSSDNSIATVNGNGLVTCITEGTVNITCTWVEQDVSKMISITVSNVNTPVIPTYTYTITSKGDLKIGISRSYTLSIEDEYSNTIDNSNFNITWNVISDFTVEQVISENKIKLKVDDENQIGNTFLLQALVNGDIVAQKEIIVCEYSF